LGNTSMEKSSDFVRDILKKPLLSTIVGETYIGKYKLGRLCLPNLGFLLRSSQSSKLPISS
jgi:hypothetical protein